MLSPNPIISCVVVITKLVSRFKPFMLGSTFNILPARVVRPSLGLASVTPIASRFLAIVSPSSINAPFKVLFTIFPHLLI